MDAEKHLDVLFPQPKIFHVGEKEVKAARLCWDDLMRIPRAFAGVLQEARIEGDGTGTMVGMVKAGLARAPELVVELAGASGTELTVDEVRKWPATAVIGYLKLAREVNPDLFPNPERLVERAWAYLQRAGGARSQSEKPLSSSVERENTPSSNSGE